MELSSPVLASSSVPPTAVGKPDTILINIIINRFIIPRAPGPGYVESRASSFALRRELGFRRLTRDSWVSDGSLEIPVFRSSDEGP